MNVNPEGQDNCNNWMGVGGAKVTRESENGGVRAERTAGIESVGEMAGSV